jgi:hypothetical protein
MTQMTVTDPDWTITQTAEAFQEDETPEVARDAADTVHAWLINNTPNRLPGWTYTDGTFTGPAREDAYSKTLALVVEANDYAIQHLDEIRADVPAT